MTTGLLREIVNALDHNGIAYMIFGSVAMNAYTIPRMTRDIDFVIELAEDNVEKFQSIFVKDFYIHKPTVEEEVRRKGMYNVIDHRSGYKIDFIVRKNSPYRKLKLARRKRSGVLGFDAWLVSPEDLILSKLIWIQDIQSERQKDDIRNLLDYYDLDREYILQWIKDLNLSTYDLL